MSEYVICKKRHSCKFGKECGGASEHLPCPECGRCPVDSDAKCEEVK